MIFVPAFIAYTPSLALMEIAFAAVFDISFDDDNAKSVDGADDIDIVLADDLTTPFPAILDIFPAVASMRKLCDALIFVSAFESHVDVFGVLTIILPLDAVTCIFASLVVPILALLLTVYAGSPPK